MRLKTEFNLIIILLLAVGLAACDSSTSSSTDADPPEPMEFSDIQMDLGIFQQGAPSSERPGHMDMAAEMEQFMDMIPDAEQMSPYEFAGIWAMSADSFFQAFAAYPQMFFNEDQWGDPELDGDTWVWEHTQSFEGESVTILVTAQETGDMVNWELRYTVVTDDGPELDNALLLSAELRQDGTAGTWTIWDFFEEDESEQSAAEFEFVIDDGLTTFLEIRLPSEDDLDNILYEVFDEIANLGYFVGDAPMTFLEWNRDTGEGYIESEEYNNGVRACWDSDFMETEC